MCSLLLKPPVQTGTSKSSQLSVNGDSSIQSPQGIIFYFPNITVRTENIYIKTKIFFREVPCSNRVGTAQSAWLRPGRSGDQVPVGARFFAHIQTGPGAHPASCTRGTCSFLEVKSGLVVTLTTHPLLVPWSRKSRAIPLLPYGQ